jgi:hypothetical protein
MRAKSLMVNLMVKENKAGRMDQCMTASFLKGKEMVLEYLYFQMGIPTMGILGMISLRVVDPTNGQMVGSTKETLFKTKCMGMVYSRRQIILSM